MVERRRAIWDVSDLASDSLKAERQFYRTLIRRHLEFRRVGGTIGAVAASIWAVVGSVLMDDRDMVWSCTYNQGSSLCYGTTTVPGTSVIAAALFGVLCGALFSEAYRLRRLSGTVRAASLAARPTLELPRVLLAARVLAGASFAGILALLIWLDAWQLIFDAGFGLALVLVAEMARKAVTDRPRPLLTPLSAAADQVMRQASSTALVWLELAAAALISWPLLAVMLLGIEVLIGDGVFARGVDFSAIAATLPVVLYWVPLAVCAVCLVKSGMRPPTSWYPAVTPRPMSAVPLAIVSDAGEPR
jgi:hypothetical protein